MSEEEKVQMRQITNHLVRRLRIKNKGDLDVKKTLRLAGKYQGVPVELKYKDKSPSRASVVALCDISGSVWSTAGFMLHLLYSLQACFYSVLKT